MAAAPRILIVDDDEAVRETFGDYLTMHGFDVEMFDGGPALRARLETDVDFHIALLDVTMPGEDGLSLARHLRERTRAGIIMVTARGDTIDRVVGLEIGADDYLPKPVELRELLARVRALLRRMGGDERAPSDDSGHAETSNARLLGVGSMRLDRDARRLIDADGRDIGLTAMEFDLLEALAERPGRVLSREQLLDLSHKNADEPFDRSIDIRIARLRRKIERDPARPQLIKTVRGVGYVFSAGG